MPDALRERVVWRDPMMLQGARGRGKVGAGGFPQEFPEKLGEVCETDMGRWGATEERNSIVSGGTAYANAWRDGSLSFRTPAQVYLLEQTS